MTPTYRPYLKYMRIAVAAVIGIAILVAVFVLWNSMGDAHPAAVRNEYLKGRITIEQARQDLGDAEVDKWDTWTEPNSIASPRTNR